MNKSSINTAYTQLFKGIATFGFTHIFKIVVSVITNKFIAVFVGPIGIGTLSIINNIINLIAAITNFENLKVATREIAVNKTQLYDTIKKLQKIALLVGVFGALITIVFSTFLSKLVFTDKINNYWFLLLSLYFIFYSYTNVRLAILQGLNNIKKQAQYAIITSVIIALGSIILYYYYNLNGIIYSIVFSSFVSFVFSIVYTINYPFPKVSLQENNFFKEASPLLKFGFILSISLLLGQITALLIRYYLKTYASIEIVGIYEVNNVLLINYLGLVFNAMAYDFYPKLSSISFDNDKSTALINQQMELGLLLVTPAVVLFYIFAPYIIEILYTKAFSSTYFILQYALFSILIKTIALPFGYYILAKANKKQYFLQEMISDLLNLILSISLYYYFGLKGIGIAFIFNYFIYTVYLYCYTKKHYNFTFTASLKKVLGICFLFGIATLLSSIFLKTVVTKYFVLSILALLSVLYSFIELKKRINFKQFFAGSK